MIKKSITIFFALFVVYNGLLYMKPGLSYGQHQQELNNIYMQKIIYDDFVKDNVITGSSLSNRLVMEKLPNYTDLTLGGLTPFVGLDILKRTNNLPKNIFIETNILFKGEMKEFSNDLFDPLPYYSKKYIPSSRDGMTPFGFTQYVIDTAIISPYFKKKSNTKQTIVEASNEAVEASNEAVEASNEAVEASNEKPISPPPDFQVQEYSTAVDVTAMADLMKTLQDYVTYFESQGIHIYFYEMPIHSELINSPKASSMRETMTEYFPKNEFEYIELPVDMEVKTNDGLHLVPESADAYTEYLKKQAEILITSQDQ